MTRPTERSLVDALCEHDFDHLPADVQERLRVIANHRFFPRQRPPPGTPWPPVVPEPVAEEPVEDAVTSQLVPGEAASSSQLLNGEGPKPKKKRSGGNDEV